jgi:nitrous oxidase accessory protein
MKRYCYSYSLLVLCLFAVVWARAEVLAVGPDGQFKTVGEAIAAARAGDTIRIANGTYVENLIIDKTLAIEGSGNTTIKGTGAGSVVEVLADNCVIRGLQVETSGGDLVREDAGILLKSKGNIIEDNELSDILFGIYLFHPTIRCVVIA